MVDSYFSDFHCVSTSGACTDAQAINGGTGSHVGGPYKIVNNFLEASTEAILMGGGAATTTPTDIGRRASQGLLERRTEIHSPSRTTSNSRMRSVYWSKET